MRAEQQGADFAAGKTFGQQIAQREKVAEGFAHLFAFHEQMRAVQPIFYEGLAGGAFALGDFILVMREDQILAAQMQIETRPEKFHAHGAALDMPAGAALAKGAGPKYFA